MFFWEKKRKKSDNWNKAKNIPDPNEGTIQADIVRWLKDHMLIPQIKQKPQFDIKINNNNNKLANDPLGNCTRSIFFTV